MGPRTSGERRTLKEMGRALGLQVHPQLPARSSVFRLLSPLFTSLQALLSPSQAGGCDWVQRHRENVVNGRAVLSPRLPLGWGSWGGESNHEAFSWCQG